MSESETKYGCIGEHCTYAPCCVLPAMVVVAVDPTEYCGWYCECDTALEPALLIAWWPWCVGRPMVALKIELEIWNGTRYFPTILLESSRKLVESANHLGIKLPPAVDRADGPNV